MKGFVLEKGLGLILPLLIGLVVPFCVDGLKRAAKWLDAAPPAVKQAMAFVVAAMATGLATALGIAVPTDLAAWDGPLVQTILAGLLGIAMKQQKQVQKLKANAAALPAVATPLTPVSPDSPFAITPTEPS